VRTPGAQHASHALHVVGARRLIGEGALGLQQGARLLRGATRHLRDAAHRRSAVGVANAGELPSQRVETWTDTGANAAHGHGALSVASGGRYAMRFVGKSSLYRRLSMVDIACGWWCCAMRVHLSGGGLVADAYRVMEPIART